MASLPIERSAYDFLAVRGRGRSVVEMVLARLLKHRASYRMLRAEQLRMFGCTFAGFDLEGFREELVPLSALNPLTGCG